MTPITLTPDNPPPSLLRTLHRDTRDHVATNGVTVEHPRALRYLRRLGARVSDNVARFDPSLIDTAIASAPTSFKISRRSDAPPVWLGNDHVAHATARAARRYLAPNGHLRTADVLARHELICLGHMLNTVDIFGDSPVLPPTHQPGDTSHGIADLLALTDKPFVLRSRSEQQVRRSLRAIDAALSVINTSLDDARFVIGGCPHLSVGRISYACADAIIQYCEARQPVLLRLPRPHTSTAIGSDSFTMVHAAVLTALLLGHAIHQPTPFLVEGRLASGNTPEDLARMTALDWPIRPADQWSIYARGSQLIQAPLSATNGAPFTGLTVMAHHAETATAINNARDDHIHPVRLSHTEFTAARAGGSASEFERLLDTAYQLLDEYTAPDHANEIHAAATTELEVATPQA